MLGNKIRKDNRIPPRGFTNAAFNAFGGKPVDPDPQYNGMNRYADQAYSDDTKFPITPPNIAPLCPDYAEVRLYYQTASKEYITFLANNAPVSGQRLMQLWQNHGKSEPVEMAMTSINISPAPLPGLVSASSVKRHDQTDYGIPLDLNATAATATIECRKDGVTQVVLKFDRNVQVGAPENITAHLDTGAQLNVMVSGSGNKTLTLDILGVPQPGCVKINLNNLRGDCGSDTIPERDIFIRSLIGDTNASARVTSADLAQIIAAFGMQVGDRTFRKDVNHDGTIDMADFDMASNWSGLRVNCNQ